MKTTLFLIGSLCLTLAQADKSSLPVLYRVDQPNSNVVVFRGADVAKARAAGLLPGGPVVKDSPPVARPTAAPYVAPTTPYIPPATSPAPPPPTTARPAPPPTPAY